KGVVMSQDGGQTWSETKTPRKASSVAIAASDPHVIYGSFFEDGLWKSTDKGKTWTMIWKGQGKGPSIKQVVVSPADPQEIYAIGTAAESYWTPHFLRSTDGGKTWDESITCTGESRGNPLNPGSPLGMSTPADLAINPLHPKELLMAGNNMPWLSNDGG